MLLAVDFELDLLVVEAQVVFYLLGLRQRLRIVPDEVLDDLTVRMHGVVRRDALVRAEDLRLTQDEQVRAYVLRRYVVAHRKAGLEEELGSLRFGDDFPVHANPDVTGALEDVDPVIGIVGVAEDLLVLLVPRV
jgi:hypothetical protein